MSEVGHRAIGKRVANGGLALRAHQSGVERGKRRHASQGECDVGSEDVVAAGTALGVHRIALVEPARRQVIQVFVERQVGEFVAQGRNGIARR